MSQPDSLASNWALFSSMSRSQLPGPKLAHVSLTCPACGNGFIAPPPVLKTLTCVGSQLSNSGVEALYGKLNTASFGSKPLSSLEKYSRHRRMRAFAWAKGVCALLAG